MTFIHALVDFLANLQTVVAVVVLAVLLYLVARAPRNVPLRAITVTIATFSLTVVFGSAARHGATVLGLAPILSRLVYHLGMLLGGYALIAFYLFTAQDRLRARRQALWQAIPAAAAAVTMVVVTGLIPPGLRDSAATVAFIRGGGLEPSVALLYLTPNVYMGYAAASALLWTRRHARGAEPQLRRALAVTAVGLAVFTLGEAAFVTATICYWAGVPVTGWQFMLGLLGVLPGSVVFMLGFAYPALRMRLAAVGIWWQHRRLYHQLGPLWTVLNRRFPEDELSRVPGRWWERLRVFGVHRRYYRRVIECRDGLVRISPYLGPEDGRPLADRLREGLAAHASGTEASSRATPVAIPAAGGLDADVRELVVLSEQLRATEGVPRSTGPEATGSTVPADAAAQRENAALGDRLGVP